MMQRNEIIDSVDCPHCRQLRGLPCHHGGKGAQKKMRLRVSHIERMQAAQKAEADKVYESLIEEGDCDAE